MRIFRYDILWYDNFCEENTQNTGFVWGEDYGSAASQIEKSCTDGDGNCYLESIELIEVDNLDGAISDNDILEMIGDKKHGERI